MTTSNRPPAELALLVQRLVLAAIIAAHGLARWWAGAVDPFGEWLGAQDGMEYSVLLIVCLLSVAYQHLPFGRSPNADEPELP